MKLGSICDPLNKRQFRDYHHTRSPAPKKFKTKASAGEVRLTVFWNTKNVVLTDFWEKKCYAALIMVY
jgi:hypothetical protein